MVDENEGLWNQLLMSMIVNGIDGDENDVNGKVGRRSDSIRYYVRLLPSLPGLTDSRTFHFRYPLLSY